MARPAMSTPLPLDPELFDREASADLRRLFERAKTRPSAESPSQTVRTEAGVAPPPVARPSEPRTDADIALPTPTAGSKTWPPISDHDVALPPPPPPAPFDPSA